MPATLERPEDQEPIRCKKCGLTMGLVNEFSGDTRVWGCPLHQRDRLVTKNGKIITNQEHNGY